ncbi:Serpin-ZX like [Actinidia chinensis var. chinensis]|uniref:Serpin-ZX like n=1 Tax=Actinidia chinensis var. chinensis TaxID=1590841 RepID=A0A2R6RN29_ACTCC|nr:Serpin-ZX like [Actinidia chinensis var. chinensis]
MDFCMNLAKQLMVREVENRRVGNIVVSPLSLNALLNMVVVGLKGPTLEHVLGFWGSTNTNEICSKSSEMMAIVADCGSSQKAEDGPILAMVNGAWVDQKYPLKDPYKEMLKTIYNCEAKSVDFATQAIKLRDEINSWAEAATGGLIKDFLEEGSPDPHTTALILANALYFKGTWDIGYKFDASLSKNFDFYLLDGATVSVPFMTSHERYPCGSFDGFKVLRIPYENGKLNRIFSMYFFLPDERASLQDLLKKLIANPSEYFNNLPHRELGKFWIPKFKFSYGFDVAEAMECMGMKLSFSKNPEDLSEMLHVPKGVPFFDPAIIQKAAIEIDEKGTEAAAATEVEFLCGSSMYKPEKLDFVADHPFVFMIREYASGFVFFTGAVINPSKSN